MDQQTQLILRPVTTPHTLGLRDIIAVPFRHRRLVILSFLATIVGLTIGLLLLPPTYEAELKFLVKRDRTNAVVTPGADPTSRPVSDELTDQDVNSEVDLISSQELERKVVLALHLDEAKASTWWKRLKAALLAHSKEEKIALAMQNLDDNLSVDPPNRSNLVRVTYDANDPQQAADVLNTLAQFYMEKHLEVHKQAGSVEFFQKQVEQHKKDLDDAKASLSLFNQKGGVVAAQLEKEATLQKLSAFEGTQRETAVAISATEQRVSDLKKQAASVPKRTTTTVRAPSGLLEELNTTLYTLESKRTELLQKYAPTYRGVRDIEEQIAATKKSIAEVEKKPLTEETTDQNPIYAWVTSELSKEQASLASLRAKQSATAAAVGLYRKQALSLDQSGLQQQTLLQNVKLAEDNYQLAMQKLEEAKVADELDRQRIANVAIAQAAVPPALPASSTLLRILIAFVLAGTVSIGAAFASDFMDPSFRTPAEAEALLNVPVLAVIPRAQDFAVHTADFSSAHSRPTGTDSL